MACQLTEIRQSLLPNSPLRKFENFLARSLRKIRDIGKRLHHSISGKSPAGGECSIRNDDQKIQFHRGDIVRVRSREQIKALLSGDDANRRCAFMHEMYQYCGRELQIMKFVESFFDEAKQRTCKCRETVILEDAVCSGKQRLYRMKCDRNCYFFWRTDWLERVEEPKC